METVCNSDQLLKSLPNEKHKKYLFKGTTDAVLYLVVYLAVPLYSVVSGISHKDYSVFFTALSTCICLIYDCYSRYEGKHQRKNAKLYALGVIYFLLGAYTFTTIQMYMSSKPMETGWFLPFVLLAVAPVVGAIDFYHMMREDCAVSGCN